MEVLTMTGWDMQKQHKNINKYIKIDQTAKKCQLNILIMDISFLYFLLFASALLNSECLSVHGTVDGNIIKILLSIVLLQTQRALIINRDLYSRSLLEDLQLEHQLLDLLLISEDGNALFCAILLQLSVEFVHLFILSFIYFVSANFFMEQHAEVSLFIVLNILVNVLQKRLVDLQGQCFKLQFAQDFFSTISFAYLHQILHMISPNFYLL